MDQEPINFIDTVINRVFNGDNLSVLRKIPSGSISLVYIDPPFNSKRNYHRKDGSHAYDDSFTSIEDYMAFMKPRLDESYRCLKPDGVIFIHCDYHANAYLRVECDRIFGYDNLINEIIWQRSSGNSLAKTKLNVVTDTILFYGKSEQHTFNIQHIGTCQKTESNWRFDKNRNQYCLVSDLTGLGFNRRFAWRGKMPGDGRSWAYSLEKLEEFYNDGRILTDKNGKPCLYGLIRYVDDVPQQTVSNLWTDFYNLAGGSSERTEYPTQKPLELLKRIILMASNEGDIVLDPFCGSGTALVAAKTLRRAFIGIDDNKEACEISLKRLKETAVFKELIKQNVLNVNKITRIEMRGSTDPIKTQTSLF